MPTEQTRRNPNFWTEAFWRTKIARNQERDNELNPLLRAKGWKVMRIWEHELSRKNNARLLRRLTVLYP